MVRKAICEKVNDQKTFYHILTREEMLGHGSLCCVDVYQPGTISPIHQQVRDFECFYVLSGRGIFTDADGSRVEVGPGDVCTIQVGQSHAIENPFDEEFKFLAIIINE